MEKHGEDNISQLFWDLSNILIIAAGEEQQLINSICFYILARVLQQLII